jgi:predicted membrane chloride channel (bestrophin family)
MITYDRSAFGLNLILRVHGSAAYRGVVPGLLSIVVLLLIRYFRNGDGTFTGENRDDNDLQHPYAVGILVASITFLIVFRANQGYNRYWESAGAIHQMMSKWMDATIHTGCYHMQCAHYDAIKPPSFFDYPELNAYFLTRDRERCYDDANDMRKDVLKDLDDGPITEEMAEDLDDQQRKHVAEKAVGSQRKSNDGSNYFNIPPGAKLNNSVVDRAVLKSINPIHVSTPQSYKEREERLKRNYSFDSPDAVSSGGTLGAVPTPLTGPPRLDGNWGKLFSDRKATYFQPKDTDPSSPNYLNNVPSFASVQGGRTPSLFLQELAHLCSLMNAVALSTLRNDQEGATSPLGVYRPGAPWPEVDPDKVDSPFLNLPWYSAIWQDFKFFLGYGRSREERTRYNAARPLEVIGGVSDAEIRFLQMARGPSAKTQLCWYWITEFIIREHLNGSTGKVGPPIISRVIQFLSDGMIYYNHARKIMFIPFPFPHAQISVIFVLVTIPAVAFLMDQFADNVLLGSCLSFLSVACLSGIHEVAREMENPFRNIPNEIPVVTFQAQFNEALLVMYSGYHPDHFWDPTKHDHHPSEPPRQARQRYGSRIHKSTRGSTVHGALSPKRESMGTPISISPQRARAVVRTSSAPGRPTATPISATDNSASAATVVRTSSVPGRPKATPISATEKSASAGASPSATPTSSIHESSAANNQTEELSKMQAKMQEYGKEIERLRILLEKSEEKKAD